MKRNVPKLRFKNFDDEWKDETLGEVFTLSSGGTPSRNNSELWNGNIPWITTGEINFNEIYQSVEKITKLALKKSSAKMFPKGTILIAMYGQGKTRGKSAILGIEATTNQACAALISRGKIDNIFAYKYISGNYDNIREMCNSGGQKNLSLSILKEFKLAYPSLQEQEKIANFLTKVDSLIEEQDEKVKDLELYKQGMMQKILSQEIRFKGFDDEWIKYKASDLFINISDKNHNGDLNVLSVTQDKGVVLRSELEIDIKYDFDSLKSYKKVNSGDFIISLRSFQGGIETSNQIGLISPAYTVFNFKEKSKFNTKFMGYILKSENFIRKMARLIYGIRDGKAISFKDFSTLNFYIPSLSEQTKIANFLSNIDSIIKEENIRLKDLRQCKKGLLQQMFV